MLSQLIRRVFGNNSSENGKKAGASPVPPRSLRMESLESREILGFLWKGAVTEAIERLKLNLPSCRTRSRVEELIGH